MSLSPLPIDDVLSELVARLREAPAVVLRAPTGAGKTTRVPPALLDAGLAGSGQVYLLEPRRLAARAAAARMSAERETPLGDLIGYQVRFEKQASRTTRILAVTDGIFTRLLQDNPLLDGIRLVLFDEFHERSLNADLALAMVRRVQTSVRPDLKIVVMSATLAAEPIAAFLGGCPIVESQGRLHPVAIEYAPFDRRDDPVDAAVQAVPAALDKTPGDLLVFLPGVGEIRRAGRLLAPLVAQRQLKLCELYGDLPLDDQQAVLAPSRERKLVLATNVAETSVTIPGVTGVVDTGLARVLRLDSARGINQLELERISRASAEQRAGRAGRTAPGVCFRLWTEREQRALAEHDDPEIARVDLAGPVLELACWGETDITAFPWFEAPPAAALAQARSLLEALGALSQGQPTELGRQLVRLPLHPRLARLLLAAHQAGQTAAGALAAALLAERDPIRTARSLGRGAPRHGSDSDVLDRVAALEAFADSGQSDTPLGPLDASAARTILRARDQLLRLARHELAPPAGKSLSPEEAVERALWAGFPDRLARRRPPQSRRGVMVGGRGVRLDDQSAVTEPELFVCVEIGELGTAEAVVRQASLVRPEWLPAEAIATAIETAYDEARERVVAFRRRRYRDLVLDEAPTDVPAEFDVSGLLAEKAAERLDLSLAWDEAAAGYLARLRSVAVWAPELKLPAIDEQAVRETLLPRLAIGCRSLAELKRQPVVPALQSLLTGEQIQAIERLAPERIAVPSGSRIALAYEPGRPPVLAVRIQELFGLAETPRVAGGRVAVLLHLLGPNYRPQQITADLASFWRNTYPEVRKELRRRYPKHAWPEDPLAATPERKPGRRQ